MALGKNLKRKKLIEEETSGQEKPKARKAPSKEPIKKAGEKSVKKATPKKNTSAPKKAEKTAPISPPKAKKGKKLTVKEVKQRTEKLQQYKEELESLKHKDLMLILFEIEQEYFAIEIEKAKMIVPLPPLSGVPNAEKYIAGMAQVRHHMTIFLDLGKKFQLEHDQEQKSKASFGLIVKEGSEWVGLLLKEVPKTYKCRGKDLREVPKSVYLAPGEETFIKYTTRHQERVVYVLDISQMILSDQGILSVQQSVAS
jgi:chemotaxis signal transduction protein